MLSQRQVQIFKIYLSARNKKRFLTAADFAAKLKVSVRTVKSDLKSLQEYCRKFVSFYFETVNSLGSRLVVLDDGKFSEDCRLILRETENEGVAFAGTTAKFVIRFLLERKDYQSKIQMENRFYLSESTLYRCMKEVKKLLAAYHLQLRYKTNDGYKIVGEELDKRICLAKLEPDTKYGDGNLSAGDDLSEIYKVVAELFLAAQYPMNEVMLQNITEHVHQNLSRIRKGYFVSREDSREDLSGTQVYPIAERILRHFWRSQFPEAANFRNEVNLLCLIILGKLEYSGTSDHLQEEMNQFVERAFLKIDKKFATNFGTLAVLKMKITFHLIPLFYRIRSKTQLTNTMADEITQKFPQAANIALYFAELIHEEYGLKPSLDEITYLNLHFNYALNLQCQNKPEKRVLIITELRQSEASLLKFKLVQWFPDLIAAVDFIHPSGADAADIHRYDAVFSTEKDLSRYQGGVSRLNFFPKESDYERINLALNGFNSINSILSKFSEDCFYYGEADSRDEALEIVASQVFNGLGQDEHEAFLASIKDREKVASSYFGPGIAMPHPLVPFTQNTVASVALLNRPIDWDGLHKVQLVILVSIARDSPVEFQFWHYLSAFVQSESLLGVLLAEPSYENFIRCLSEALLQEF